MTRRELNEKKNKKLRKGWSKVKGNQPERDPKYLAFVRSLNCIPCILEQHGVFGRLVLGDPMTLMFALIVRTTEQSQACHMGPHGIGQKASDYTAIPMCAKHHEQIGSSVNKLEVLGINYAALVAKLREAFEASKA